MRSALNTRFSYIADLISPFQSTKYRIASIFNSIYIDAGICQDVKVYMHDIGGSKTGEGQVNYTATSALALYNSFLFASVFSDHWILLTWLSTYMEISRLYDEQGIMKRLQPEYMSSSYLPSDGNKPSFGILF